MFFHCSGVVRQLSNMCAQPPLGGLKACLAGSIHKSGAEALFSYADALLGGSTAFEAFNPDKMVDATILITAPCRDNAGVARVGSQGNGCMPESLMEGMLPSHSHACHPYAMQVINVTQSYCLDAEKPFSWIHPLKLPQHMHAISRMADACTSI